MGLAKVGSSGALDAPTPPSTTASRLQPEARACLVPYLRVSLCKRLSVVVPTALFRMLLPLGEAPPQLVDNFPFS